METGTALQDHVDERLAGIVEKYFDRAISSHVTFGKAPAGAFACDIVMHVMQGLILKSQADAQDAHKAFEAAADKIEKQLRRYKRRIKDRPEQSAYALREDEAAYVIFAVDDSDGQIGADAPPVIAANTQAIPETHG